jgi:hypothetical protein
MKCPHCLSPVPDIAVRGRRYRLRGRRRLKRPHVRGEGGEFLYCEPIPVLVIESKERNHEHTTPKVSTRHSPVQKLPENVPAHRRSKVPVLQEAARKSAGEIERNF